MWWVRDSRFWVILFCTQACIFSIHAKIQIKVKLKGLCNRYFSKFKKCNSLWPWKNNVMLFIWLGFVCSFLTVNATRVVAGWQFDYKSTQEDPGLTILISSFPPRLPLNFLNHPRQWGACNKRAPSLPNQNLIPGHTWSAETKLCWD